MPITLPRTPNPAQEDSYRSDLNQKRGRPMLFQVVDPMKQPIFPFLLALHTNPETFSEKYTKSKVVAMTYGGFVEWIWPDELDSISASHSTGAFLGPFAGLSTGSDGISDPNDPSGIYTRAGEHGRHGTMAWERQEDLLDLFRHNGVIFDGQGHPAIRGQVMCIYDRGIFIGHFKTFQVKETDEKAFSFQLDWEFGVEAAVYNFPTSANLAARQPILNANTQQAALDKNQAAAPSSVVSQSATNNNGPVSPAPSILGRPTIGR